MVGRLSPAGIRSQTPISALLEEGRKKKNLSCASNQSQGSGVVYKGGVVKDGGLSQLEAQGTGVKSEH